MMIAHSFTGDVFGPAQRLHGATYVVDVEFRRPDLDSDGVVVDIGRAGDVLSAILHEWNYRNLDEVFPGRNTTTEFLARAVFDRMADAISRGELGAAAHGIESVRVTLHESHIASAAYDGLVAKRVRIATMDLRIAAIALDQGLTLLTRNARDFSKVPGLIFEDWTI